MIRYYAEIYGKRLFNDDSLHNDSFAIRVILDYYEGDMLKRYTDMKSEPIVKISRFVQPSTYFAMNMLFYCHKDGCMALENALGDDVKQKFPTEKPISEQLQSALTTAVKISFVYLYKRRAIKYQNGFYTKKIEYLRSENEFSRHYLDVHEISRKYDIKIEDIDKKYRKAS